MTTIDVDAWSKTAASNYLTKGTPLHESITKIASEQGLNRDQIARVVEAANTEVYINLFNKADDKYISYETADAEKIAEAIFGQEKTSSVSDDDYQELPSSPIIEDQTASDALTKTAEVKPTNVSDTDKLHEYYKIAALETRLGQSLDEVEVRYQNDSAILFSMIKQAVLSGTTFGDVERALTSVYDSPVIKVNINEAREKLASELYPKNLNMNVTYTGTVNMENPLVKQAGLLLKHASEFSTLRTKHAEARTQLTTHIKTSGMIPLKKEAKLKHYVAAAGAGMLAGGALVSEVGKKRQEQAAISQQMKQLPSAYVR